MLAENTKRDLIASLEKQMERMEPLTTCGYYVIADKLAMYAISSISNKFEDPGPNTRFFESAEDALDFANNAVWRNGEKVIKPEFCIRTCAEVAYKLYNTAKEGIAMLNDIKTQ